MKLHRDRLTQQSIFFSVSLSKAVLILFYYCLSGSASGQAQPTPKSETTPLIPPAGQPSATPTAEPQLPENKGVGGQTKPLIPAIQSPTPSASPGASPGTEGKLVGGMTQERAAEFDRMFDSALAVIKQSPPGLLPVSLIDSVRIALSQNPDLRLSAEDSQSARGKLKEAMGEFDTTFRAVAFYAYSIPAAGSNQNLNNEQQVLTQALPAIFQALGLSSVGSNAAISNAITQAVQKQELKPTENLNTLVSVSKKLRNGITLELAYQPLWVNQAGNIEYPPTANRISLSMSLPIGKKGGTFYNDSKEITSIIDYEGSLLKLRNAAQKAALETAQSYWSLVASLQKFALQDRAFRVSALLYDLSDEMAKGGGISYSDVTLAQARRSEAFAQRIQALVAVYQAANKLGVTMGLRSDQLKKLPLAFQPFPTVTERQVTIVNPENLVDAALARRLDRAAALNAIRSKHVDLEKAKRDLIIAPEVFVALGGVINNETTQNSSGQKETGTRLGWDSSIAASFAWPFANNVAEGALMDAQANLNSAIINMESLSTSIAANVTTSIDTLQELAKDIASEVKAVGQYRQSFTDMREKFRSGASTMLDTIQTEQRLTTAETTLVDLRLAMANAIAQLRYETSSLLSSETTLRVPGFPQGLEQTSISQKAFETLPDISKPVGPILKDRNYDPNIKYISGRPPWHH
jgi:outer membrane protein TolC